MAVDMNTVGDIISSVSESIASITKTISDNTTERERIRMQGRQIDAEIADRMKARDTETKKFLREQQSKLDALCIEHDTRLAELKVEHEQNKGVHKKEVKGMHLNHKERMTELANERRRDEASHKERMEFLTIIRECVQEANRQVTIYRDDRMQYGEVYYPLEGVIASITSATERLNAAAQTLMLPSKGD